MWLFKATKPRGHASGSMGISGSDGETESQPKETSKSRIAQTHGDSIALPDDVPRTRREAQDHIAQIRADKNLDGHVEIVKDLEAALGVISNDMYRNPTRFLLELIQNADDNTYSGVQPTMRITYKNRTLRFDTNEIGFSRTNVKAICSIGDSSKTAVNHCMRTIGEKGIGFKSVFAVSEVVWVNSGQYQFKFHSKKALGRLAPIWADFPEERLDKFTTILLQFRPDLDIAELLKELKELGAKYLMFLRRLQAINIIVYEDENIWKASLTRHRHRMEEYGRLESLTLQPDRLSPYVVFSHEISHLPEDQRRKECNKTEMMLAFPSYPASQGNFLKTQHVYAFLPVRDYGLKFILHADFILIANREDIDSSSTWNKALFEEIPQALLGAINEFNSGSLRYWWLPYVLLDQSKRDFFQDLEAKTIQLLSTQPILESSDGILRPPVELTYVPRKFVDGDEAPLIPADVSRFKYVSHKYPIQDLDTLGYLGATCLSDQDFIDDLASFISRREIDFRQMPAKWHSRLSQVLNSLLSTHRDSISTLPIVPLVDGHWIAPIDGTLMCPWDYGKLAVPKGIRTFQVHSDVATDDFRRGFLANFGLRDLDLRKVCDIVIQTHKDVAFRPESIPTEDLISHVEFLQQAGWPFSLEKPECDLWFVTESGSCCRGSQLYVDSELPYSATRVFAGHRSSFRFLHENYTKVLSNKPGNWNAWLYHSMGVETIPRLVTLSRGQDRSFTVADDFRFILNSFPSSYVLQLLKCHWSSYSRWIIPGSIAKNAYGMNTRNSKEESKSNLRAMISSMEVLCLGGSFSPLSQTYVPRESVLLGLGVKKPASAAELDTALGRPKKLSEITSKPLLLTLVHRKLGHLRSIMNNGPDTSSPKVSFGQESIELPLLDVPDIESPMWDFLNYFGVAVTLELKDFIYRLRGLRLAPVTKHHVSLLYTQIENHSNKENLSYIRESFKDHELIFIPESTDASESGRWVNMDGCVWEGPSCLKKIPLLNRHWQEQKSFFRDLLRLQDASLKTVIEEAKKITHTDSLEYILAIFIAISSTVDKGPFSETWEMVHELQTYQMFPVWTRAYKSNHSTFDFLMSEPEEWFIPDHEGLHSGFEGQVPLLAFSPSTVARLMPLLEIVNLKDKLLSAAAVSILSIEGKVDLNDVYTDRLRSKARYIARLVPQTVSDKGSILDHLRHIQVYNPENISMRWVLVTSQGTFQYLEPGRVGLLPEAGVLKVYLTMEDGDAQWPPVELTQQLSSFCGISDPKHASLLAHILIQVNLRRIEEDLKKQGVPNPTDGFDELAAANNLDDQKHVTSDQTNLVTPESDCKETGIVSPSVPSGEGLTQRTDNQLSIVISNPKTMKSSKDTTTSFTSHSDRIKDESTREIQDNIEVKPKETHTNNATQPFTAPDTNFGKSTPAIVTEHCDIKTRGNERGLRVQGPDCSSSTNIDGASACVSEPNPARNADRKATETENISQGLEEVSESSPPSVFQDRLSIPFSNPAEILQHDRVQYHSSEKLYPTPPLAGATANGTTDNSVSNKLRVLGNIYSVDELAANTRNYESEVIDGYRTPLRPRSPRNDFKGMKHGVLSLSSPSITFRDSGDSKEIQFIAELYVSKFLEKVLEEDYQPKDHWTSSLRTRAGYNAYQRQHEDISIFTIHDKNRRVVDFLTRGGYTDASYLGDSPTFHIEVCASVDDIKSAFTLDRGPSEKACKYTMAEKTRPGIRELFILARVGSIYKDPEIALYVDPWQMHKNGLLSLESYHGYWALFKDDAPAIRVTKPRFADESTGIYQNHGIEPSTEIRLLELHKGEGESPLSGDIHTAQISSPGRYWALSYVWGTTCTAVAEYYLETPNGKILVTASLYLALKSIRERGVGVPIWVDVICINQRDSLEKSLQIRLMGQIYERAERVMVWLGTEEDNSQQVMKTLENIGMIHPATGAPSGSNQLTEIPPLWSASRVPCLTDKIWSDIDSLLRRSWFTRAWIVQELVRGSDVFIVCGKSELKWEHFFGALKACEEELNKTRHSNLESTIVLPNAGPAYALGNTRAKLKQRIPAIYLHHRY